MEYSAQGKGCSAHVSHARRYILISGNHVPPPASPPKGAYSPGDMPATWGGFLCLATLRLLGDVSFVFLSLLWPSWFQGPKSFDLGISEDMCVMIVSGIVWPSPLL